LQVGRPPRESLLPSIELDPNTIWRRRLSPRGSQPNCTPSVELQKWPSTPNPGETNEPLINNTRGNCQGLLPCLELPNEWLNNAKHLGLNATFRPFERLNASGNRHKFPRREFLYAFGFVTLAWFTAFTHSFFAVGHFGFGCRSLIWTLIYLGWVLSFSTSCALQSSTAEKWLGISSYERLWHITVAKDASMSAFIVGAITITHIGMTSTCFCKGGNILPPVWQHPIDLLPLPSTKDRLRWVQITASAICGLILMCILILCGVYRRKMMGTVLSPSKEERKKMQLRISRLREQGRRAMRMDK